MVVIVNIIEKRGSSSWVLQKDALHKESWKLACLLAYHSLLQPAYSGQLRCTQPPASGIRSQPAVANPGNRSLCA